MLVQTVIVAVVTSNVFLAHAPGNFVLTRRQSGLPKDSVVDISQLITLDRSYLTERVGRLRPNQVQTLDEGLRLVLSV
jgi:mRNA interferase MazF